MTAGQRMKPCFVMAIVLAWLAGCADPAQVKPMTAPAPPAELPLANPALARAVCVERVRGGKATHPLWASEVDNQAFFRALEGSLANHGLLAAAPADCRFAVESHLLGLSQPFISIDVEVVANVNYRVRQAAVAEPYLLSTQRSDYTVGFTQDQVLWATRLKAANEGAIQRNIAAFIETLRETPPPPAAAPPAPPTGGS